METVWSFVIGILGLVGMMLIWVLVQSYWRKTFKDNISDDDVLAERRSCGNCGCVKVCERKGTVGGG
jgi:hypothetical protein